MHKSIPLLVLLSLAASAPGAQAHEPSAIGGEPLAHGEYLNHLRPWQVELGPSENASQTLAFEGTPLPGGWLLVVHGVVHNGTMEASLEDNGTLAAWTWTTGSHTQTVRVAHTGFPSLRLRNDGAENASATVSYDQTCDCLGKATALERGPLLFNIDAEEAERVHFGFTFVPVRATIDTPTGAFNGSLRVDVRRVVADTSGQNLTVLAATGAVFASHEATDCKDIGRFSGCMDVTFDAPHTGRQVLLLQVAHNMEGWVTQVQPVIEVGAADRGMPGVPAVVGMAVFVAVALCMRRRDPGP